MEDATRMRALKIALCVVGVIFIVGVYPLSKLWPSGWAWHESGRSEYLEMIMVLYATLGVFLLLASRDPLANRSLISFTVWSSIAHGGVMAAQSLGNHHHRGHLVGDVPALFIVAALLWFLMPRTRAAAP
jgi:hypothetical protein